MIYVYAIAAFWLFGGICWASGFAVGRRGFRQALADRPYVRDLDFTRSSRGVR